MNAETFNFKSIKINNQVDKIDINAINNNIDKLPYILDRFNKIIFFI
jgi:hypothetical protein